jgi:glutathione S-transferase
MRARLALQASGVEVEWREIVLKDKPQALLLASPKATVPVLVLPDGRVLEHSLSIMLWALEHGDPLHWLPRNANDWSDARAAIARNDGLFKQALDRYKYPGRFQLSADEMPRTQAALILQDWDLRLQQQPFLSGAQWGLQDAALAPFVRQFAHVDAAWFAAQDWPFLRHWLTAFEDSKAFAGVMQKAAAWQAGDAPRLTRFAAPAAV